MVKKEILEAIKNNQQVKDILTSISELGFDKKVVAEKFEEMMSFDAIKNQEDKPLQAALLSKAYFVANMERPTFPFKALVLRSDLPKKYIRKKDKKEGTLASAKLIGFKVGKEAEGLKLLDLMAFDSNAEKIRQLIKGRFFEFNASGDLREDGETYGIGLEDSTNITDITDKVPAELKEKVKTEADIYNLLKTKYPIVDLAEAEMKCDDKFHMIEGIIVNGSVRPTKDGTKTYGRLTIMDNSLTIEDVKRMKGGFSVMVPPDEVRHSNLSKVGILTKFSTSPEYGAGGNGELTFRIWGNDREPQPAETPAQLGASDKKEVINSPSAKPKDSDDIDF